jgi:GPH family glycoside/pentoside/hexuronide:cation symporter
VVDCKKFAAAVGIGAGLSILGLAGYTPNAEQPAAVQMTLRVLYALVPSLCNIVAIVIAFAYPISSHIHAEIREAIEQRRAGLPVANPLKPAQILT